MKKKKTNLYIPEYYAYYDKATGRICSITNEKSVVYKHFIKIDIDEYTKFCNEEWLTEDYIVVAGKTLAALDGKSYDFKSSIFEWIIDPSTIDTDLSIVWNSPSQHWEFKLSKKSRNDIAELSTAGKLIFFVTLEHDFDFLVRTIVININDLVQVDKFIVPFASNLEKNIEKISISSVRTFKTYGLDIVYE